ncbi:MAG: response regulator [Rickettsiales bacterium]
MELSLKNLNVMVIDDQSTMRSIIRQILNTIGIKKIKEAKNGADAIEELTNNKISYDNIDIIICDLYMDKMDGISFIREIRNGNILSNKDIPILMLTGNNDKLIEDVVLQVGATKILKKPISSEALKKEIQKVVAIDKNINKTIDSDPAQCFDNKQIKSYKKGDTIFSQGDEGFHAYIIMSGKVGLYRELQDKSTPFGILEKNSIFGEMALFDNKHRLVTAIAIENTECSIIDEKLLQSQFAESPLLTQIILRNMVRTIKRLSS